MWPKLKLSTASQGKAKVKLVSKGQIKTLRTCKRYDCKLRKILIGIDRIEIYQIYE